MKPYAKDFLTSTGKSIDVINEGLQIINNQIVKNSENTQFVLKLFKHSASITSQLRLITEAAENILCQDMNEDTNKCDENLVYIFCPTCGEIFEYDYDVLIKLFQNVNEADHNYIFCEFCEHIIDLNTIVCIYLCADCGCVVYSEFDDYDEDCPNCSGKLSFNLKDTGECPECGGYGYQVIENTFCSNCSVCSTDNCKDIDKCEICIDCGAKHFIQDGQVMCKQCIYDYI